MRCGSSGEQDAGDKRKPRAGSYGQVTERDRSDVSVLSRRARRRYEPAARDFARGARVGRQARTERRATDSRRRPGAARSAVRAVGPGGEDEGRRALEAVRGSAEAGEGGADYEADEGLR